MRQSVVGWAVCLVLTGCGGGGGDGAGTSGGGSSQQLNPTGNYPITLVMASGTCGDVPGRTLQIVWQSDSDFTVAAVPTGTPPDPALLQARTVLTETVTITCSTTSCKLQTANTARIINYPIAGDDWEVSDSYDTIVTEDGMTGTLSASVSGVVNGVFDSCSGTWNLSGPKAPLTEKPEGGQAPGGHEALGEAAGLLGIGP